MDTVFGHLFATLVGLLRSRAVLHLEFSALRQQLAMIKERDRKRIRFRGHERLFWISLYRCWSDFLRTLRVFKPDTLVCWHRKGFRIFWCWKSRHARGGRPSIDPEVRQLIRRCRETMLDGVHHVFMGN